MRAPKPLAIHSAKPPSSRTEDEQDPTLVWLVRKMEHLIWETYTNKQINKQTNNHDSMNGGKNVSSINMFLFVYGMVQVNSQSNITVPERESNLICETYLEFASTPFVFSFIKGVFILVAPSSSFLEGI